MEKSYPLSSLTLLLFVILVSFKLFQSCVLRWKLRNIPIVGSSSLLSWVCSVNFLTSPRQVLREGYARYYGHLFKIAMVDKWIVVATGPTFVDDIRRAPDDVLSFDHAIVEQIQFEYTLGWRLSWTPYHIQVLRGPLTRNIGTKIEEGNDEIMVAFAEELPLATTTEYETVKAMEVSPKIVFRVVNRILLGLPYCRNEEFREKNIKLVVDAAIHSTVINLLPTMFQPIAGRLLTNQPKIFSWVQKFLRPLIQDRLDKDQRYGKRDWEGRPNDVISWLIDHAPPDQASLFHIVTRVLVIEFAAILTTSMAFTNAILNLAAYPEYVAPLRQEVETVLTATNGWTKSSLTKLRKMDSFLRETERMCGSGAFTVIRKALKDFTFSDGTVIPKGCTVTACAYGAHHDENVYENPEEFRPFRFSDIRDQDGEVTKHQFVSTNTDWIIFGHGKHACPGRFFAAAELKLLLSHILLNYDVKLPDGTERPATKMFAQTAFPDPEAKVMFRKRRQ